MRGVVIKSTGSWYNVLDEKGAIVSCRIKGAFRIKGIKSTNPIAVGDYVNFEIDVDGNGVIDNIEDRRNYIIRKSINLSKQSHILAANIDQALLIATLALPVTSAGFIDRFLVTAEAYHIPAIIIFNKLDFFEGDDRLMKSLSDFMNIYEDIGYTCYKTSSIDKRDVELFKELTKNKTTLIAGHSGVGKTSFLKMLDNKLQLRIGNLSEAHLKGKHTTTFAEMHQLSYGGFIIDTPGIKELGLVDMEKEEIGDYFPEIRRIKAGCKFNNCLHINEPQCAIIKAVDEGDIHPSRYRSYLSILNSEEMQTEYL